MKNFDGRFGSIHLQDALQDRIVIHIEGNDDAETFASIDDAVAADWVID